RHSPHPRAWRASALAWVALLVLAALALYAGRRLFRPLLDAPYNCGASSGCITTSPAIATAVMFAFDAILIAVAVWHLRTPLPTPSGPGRSRPWWAGLIGILVAALVVRFVLPGSSMFRWDEANMASLSIEAFIQGRLALTGIDTTVHLPNLPGVIYLIAPVLVPFQSQPGAQRALIALVSILSTVTCLLCAWFVYRWTGSRAAALASAAAFALGFWAVFVGRRPWQNAFMPAFVVLFLDAVLVLAVFRRSQALVWAGVWLVVLVQLHYLAITLAPLLLAALWLTRRALRVRDVMLTGALALVLLSPFLLWEVSSVNLLRDVRHAQFLAEQPSAVDASSIQMVLQLAGTAGIQPWAGPQWGPLQQTLWLPLLLGQVGVVLLLVGMAGCVARLVVNRGPASRPVAAFVLAAIVLPVVLLLRHAVPIESWYFYLLLPVIAILIGFGTVWPIRVLGLVGLAVYAVCSMIVIGTLLVWAQTQLLGDFEPVGPVATAGAAAYDAWRTDGSQQPLLVGAQSRDADQMILALGPRTPVQRFDDCAELPGTADGASDRIYFFRDDTPSTAQLAQTSGVRLLREIPRPGEAPYRIYAVPPGALSSTSFGDSRAWADCEARR
ncbi:MAG: glycosyltransferase family 39 protein, partial [Chloroflexi bacterium]|nr:glycosyltransferase family 39 protein [Chloroflexota bacterium]